MINSGRRSGTVVVNSVTICLGHKVPRANVILGVSGRVFYFIYLFIWCKKVILIKQGDKTHGQKELPMRVF